MQKIIITSGYFNPLHVGHVNLLREAKERGDKLVVIVNNDNQAKLKGSLQFMPEEERLAIVQSITYVDHAMLSIDQTRSVAESLKKVAQEFEGQLFFAKGGDRNVGNIPEDEKLVCKAFNIEIINDIGGGKIQSSSWLIENIVNVFLSVKKRPSMQLQTMEVLGNKINVMQIPGVVSLMDNWINNEPQKTHWIVATSMHGIMEAQKNPEFKKMLATSDLWVPDGIPLVWLARANGFNIKKRVAGPDLFHAVLAEKKYSHFLYGDTDETLQKMQEKFSDQKIDVFSPPFRKLSEQEDADIVQKINDAKPDILWVGLGLPKQERWIFEHKDKLNVPVIVGVGAAFKFEAGLVKRAPAWMGNAGFEWLWRLFQEPKRVWRRVFIDAPQFVWLTSMDVAKRKLSKKSS
jgi:N-acetylglucosaminyldiphosphoundecaprenol N-acetyl-beta-D-mannosaminyltransferase